MENDVNIGETVIDVNVTSIDRTVDYSGKLIVAKIDVEGGELDVIRGMEKTLTNNHVHSANRMQSRSSDGFK
jgi:FkbM family methyltransferase